MANSVTNRHTAFRPGAVARWKVAVLAVAVLVGLAGLALLFRHNPAHTSLFPSCPFHALTGLHCPGCGSLRAVHQLLHGNVPAALGLNPLMVACLPFLAYASLREGARIITGRSPSGGVLPARWIWTLLGVILLYWILRNVPVYPCSLLAP